MSIRPCPRLLISIDYEPWASMLQREYNHAPSSLRQEVDAGYTHSAMEELLSVFTGKAVSIFLVGEIASWYPDIPGRILAAGHELGFHGQSHRPLVVINELQKDLQDSAAWREKYNVKGYRAPIIGISREAYPLLAASGFSYSSSVYGPTGYIHPESGICELPVSTLRTRRGAPRWWWPRNLSTRLLLEGEFPYGSSFSIGLFGQALIPLIHHELKAGRSPVLVLHNYQVVPPPGWPRQIFPLLKRDPLQLAFTTPRRKFLERLLAEFPVGALGTWLEECGHSTPCPGGQP